MDEITLEVERREVTGRGVRVLRRNGITPANVDGKEMESLAIQANATALNTVVRTAGHTALVRLRVAGDSGVMPAMVSEIQRDPLTGQLVHVGFHRVGLRDRVTVEVPVILVGASEAVRRGAVLISSANHVRIEAIATAIPQQLEVDVTVLENEGDSFHARDLVLPEGSVLASDGDILIAAVKASSTAAEMAADEAEAPEPTEAEAPAAAASTEEEAG